MPALVFISRIAKIPILATAFLGVSSSVCYGVSSSCIKSEAELNEIIAPYLSSHEKTVACVVQVKKKIPCSDFSELVNKSKENYLQLTMLYTENKCIDFLLLGLLEYDLFYRNAARSLADYPAITTEYDKVSKLAKQSLQDSDATVVYKDEHPEKLLRVISQDLDSERTRVSSIVRTFKWNVGVGIGLTIVGAGLLTGGASLFALDGTTAAPLGCPTDGRDSECIRQVNPAVAGTLTGVGLAVLLGGLGEAIGARVWLDRKQTPAQSLRPKDSKPDDSKGGDAKPIKSTTPATTPTAPALDAAPAGSP